ncbi:MAG: cyclic nucleotide-binding domain-containing protein [bacterium]|nr:cyclic nucleotide-binding domain-containing protein [bacterium]
MPTPDQIRDVMLFAGLDDSELEVLASRLKEESFAKNEFIFNEGDTGDKFYIVDSGMVSITLVIEGVGTEELLYLERPAFFGEMALIDAAPRSASAVCRKDSKLLSLGKADFEKLIVEDIKIGNKIMIAFIRTFCTRIRKSNEKLRNYYKIHKAFESSS